MRAVKSFFIGLLLGTLLLILFIRFGLSARTDQPIAFNHKKHHDQGIECASCHPHFKAETFSGLPGIETCLECHKDPLTESPEEQKIRKIQREGKPLRWKRLYGQPDHVFFSHRRHVVLGGIACQTCHGEIGQSEKPPSRPWVRMTMKWCMDCHAKARVTNDCLACHV